MLVFLLISGGLADLIFVFFDPMGQALCRRTLNVVGEYHVVCKVCCVIVVVERLNEKHTDRIKFYLSKSDTAGSETDRQVSVCCVVLCVVCVCVCSVCVCVLCCVVCSVCVCSVCV